LGWKTSLRRKLPFGGLAQLGERQLCLANLQVQKNMIDSKILGNTTEMECMLECMKLGIQVSIPFGEDSRYDFIMEYNGKLYRIQSKHCTEVFDNDGHIVAIKFKTVRQSGSNATVHTRTKYTKNEIDYFSTSYNGKCYLVPVEQCSTMKQLRIISPKNGQEKGVSFLDDYELSEVLKTL
jgi:YHS domain-containing protein